jgi:hypothetical protein
MLPVMATRYCLPTAEVLVSPHYIPPAPCRSTEWRGFREALGDAVRYFGSGPGLHHFHILPPDQEARRAAARADRSSKAFGLPVNLETPGVVESCDRSLEALRRKSAVAAAWAPRHTRPHKRSH